MALDRACTACARFWRGARAWRTGMELHAIKTPRGPDRARSMVPGSESIKRPVLASNGHETTSKNLASDAVRVGSWVYRSARSPVQNGGARGATTRLHTRRQPADGHRFQIMSRNERQCSRARKCGQRWTSFGGGQAQSGRFKCASRPGQPPLLIGRMPCPRAAQARQWWASNEGTG